LCRAYLAEKFPGIIAAKIKEGVFIGPHWFQLFRDEQFDRIPSGNERRAWNDFGLVVTRFPGNNKADNCREHVENLLLSYQIGLQYAFNDAFSEFSPGIFRGKL
jgi:hypothetical protein